MGDYSSQMVQAAYNTVNDRFMMDGFSTEDNTPLEFLAILRRGLNDYRADNPDATEISLASIDFPFMEEMPEFIPHLSATVIPGAGYTISSQSASLGNVSYFVPEEFERYGEFFDAEPDIDARVLPLGELSDSSLELAEKTVDKSFETMARPTNIDELTFLQAQQRELEKGNEKFTWRGEDYSTVSILNADRTRGFDIRYENNVPDFVKDDPYGADYTGQMVIADE